MTAGPDQASPPASPATAPDARAAAAPFSLRRGRARLMTGLVIALAVLVHAPTLKASFWFDDYSQMLMLEGRYPSNRDTSGPFDLFNFIDDSSRDPLVERGMLPWWSNPHMEVHFFRPLSSALVWLDYRVFHLGAFWAHAHSLLWWAVASIAVQRLFAMLFSRRVAWMAAVSFAFSPAHAIPLVWLANRSALVSVAFGAVALAAYVRWRETGRRRLGAASFALFALALSAGEYGLCFAGYVVAIEIFRRRESLSRRALGLAPFVVPVGVHFAVFIGGHFGAHGSGFYCDPFHDFTQFVLGAPRVFAVLACSAWLGIDATGWAGASGWAVAALGLAACALLSVPIRLTLGSLDRTTRERASFMLVGSFFALGPGLAVAISPRVLGTATIGVSAIVALVVDRAWFAPASTSRIRTTELCGAVALILGFVHLARGPLDSWVSIRNAVAASDSYNERMAWLRERAEGKREVVILRAATSSSILFAPVMLDEAGPATIRTLSFTSGPVLLLRSASRSLELVSSKAPLFSIGPTDMFRNFDVPVRKDESVDLAGMRATILQLSDDGRPRRLRFDFDHDIDDPRIGWFVEGEHGFREQELPEVGRGEPINR